MINKKIKYKQYLIKWLMYKKNYVKKSTYANYSNLIYNYIIPNLGDYNLYKINNEIIQKYILHLYNNGKQNEMEGLSIKTIKDIVAIVKTSIKKAFCEGIIKSFDLSFTYPKATSNKNVYVLAKNEQNKIMKYVLSNINCKNIGILMSLLLGIRIGELCAMKWKDIDFDKHILHINKTIQRIYIKEETKNISEVIISSPKSTLSNRDIPINKEFLAIIKKVKTSNEDYVLTGTYKYMEPRVYRYYFNNLLKKLNIKHFKFHSLRDTFATNCISLGIDYKTVSELLGHSNINITLNLYVHPLLSEKRKCINNIYKNLVK